MGEHSRRLERAGLYGGQASLRPRGRTRRRRSRAQSSRRAASGDTVSADEAGCAFFCPGETATHLPQKGSQWRRIEAIVPTVAAAHRRAAPRRSRAAFFTGSPVPSCHTGARAAQRAPKSHDVAARWAPQGYLLAVAEAQPTVWKSPLGRARSPRRLRPDAAQATGCCSR